VVGEGSESLAGKGLSPETLATATAEAVLGRVFAVRSSRTREREREREREISIVKQRRRSNVPRVISRFVTMSGTDKRATKKAASAWRMSDSMLLKRTTPACGLWLVIVA